MKSKFINLYALHILNDGFQASILLLLPFIAKDLSMNLTQVGAVGTSMNLLQVFMALPAGLIAARVGSAKLLLISLVLYGLGYLGITVSPNFVFLLAPYLLAGIGFALFHPIAFAMVAKNSEKDNRGKIMGNFTAIGDVGRIGIAGVITYIIVYLGWRSTALFGGLAILLFSLIFFIFQNKNKKINIAEKKQSLNIGLLLKNKLFVLSSLSGAFDSFASSSLFVFLPFLLLYRGANPATLGSLSAAFFIGNFAGKTLLGRMVDKFGNSNVFVASEILMAVFIVILANSPSFVVIIAASIILGIFTKGTVPVIQTMVSESVEKHGNFEQAFGVNSLVVGIATTLAPICLGFFSDKYGIISAFNVSAIFAICAVLPSIIFEMVKKAKKI